MTDCDCEKLLDYYQGKRVEDITELSEFVEEISTDFRTWETEYVCNACGQVWLEKYIAKGHSEIPVVEKMEEGSGEKLETI